tara:strand:- start:407 stop:595 length:189 start_codon:yes stop_codon:yes gene_type:complete
MKTNLLLISLSVMLLASCATTSTESETSGSDSLATVVDVVTVAVDTVALDSAAYLPAEVSAD